MTKTEYEKRIEELEEKQDELQKQINELKQVKVEEQKKKWMPEYSKEYWFVGDNGEIYMSIWGGSCHDKWRYLTGNVFKTEQEAEEHKNKLKVQAQFRNFVEKRNEELDWENNNQEKYFLNYSYNYEKIIISFTWVCKYQDVIYASSEQILQDAIEEIGEENVKKYVLEVEDE